MPQTNHEPHAAAGKVVQSLQRELRRCSRSQRDEPDVFLAHARKALEAVAHLLWLTLPNVPAPSKGHKGDRPPLDGMIEQLRSTGVIDEAIHARFNALRTHGNAGAHFRGPDHDYRVAWEDTATLLPRVIVWLIEESPAAPLLGDTQRLRALAAEIAGGGRVLSGLVEEIPEDEESEEVTDAPTPHAQRTAPTPRPPPASGVSRAIVLALSLTGGLGALAVVLVLILANREPSTVPRAPGDEAGRSNTVAQASMVQPPAEVLASPAPVPACPEDMRRVDGVSLTLVQPERSTWPKPTGALSTINVAPFCLDKAPVTGAAFAAWSASARVRVLNTKSDGRACDWRTERSPDQPVVCVDRDNSEAYCASLSPPRRLPRIEEWEVLGQEDADFLRDGLLREWAEDRFPPAVFKRRPSACRTPECQFGMFYQPLVKDGQITGLSWNKQESGQGHANLGFRCAMDPSPR